MSTGIHYRNVIEVYRNDKLLRSFEKINTEPLKIRWESETANKYFMWNGQKFYFHDFERIHDNSEINDKEKELYPPDIIMRSKRSVCVDTPELFKQYFDGAHINIYVMTLQ